VVTGAGFLIAVVGLGTRYSFGVFFKSIESEFALTRGATSGVFSIYMLLCCVFAVLGGWALDRYGPKVVVFLMGSFTGLSLLLTSQANSVWQLLISYGLLLSLGTGAIYAVVNSTASRWFDKKRGFVLGITTSGGGFGAIVMAPFATYLISNFGWRTAFIVMGLIAWLVISSMCLILKKEPGDMGLLPDGVKSEAAQPGPQKKESKAQLTGLSVLQASRTSNFWFLGLIWLLLSLDVHLVFVHVVSYAVDMGNSLMDAAIILALIGGTTIPGRLLVGRVSDTIGRKAPAIACAVLQVGALLWLMWAQELWKLYVFAIAFGFLWGGLGVLTTALIGDVFGMRSIGAIMGMMSAGWALGAASGPAIGGYIFDVSGTYFMAFAAGAVAILIAALLVALVTISYGSEASVVT
jgi:MFS family permease